MRATFGTAGSVLVAMAVLAVVELAIPLHARGRWNRAHLGPNLALTAITFLTNVFFNAAVLIALVWEESRGLGLLRWARMPAVTAGIISIVFLDFALWLAHVAMHKSPALWRVHRVHHSDPAVDVTTTIRQHPVEGVIRYVFVAPVAFALGASPGAYAIYRTWAALNGLLEHANLAAPPWLDRALALVTTWPHMHKVHHSRVQSETDTNYGNLFSFFDRLFGTYTPSVRGPEVVYGLDGFDDPAVQSTVGLLRLPFRADVVEGAGTLSPDLLLRASAGTVGSRTSSDRR